ncbi:MAG: 4'-phosphopantetheinyl transferase superfamily protein [Filimonas sp.]|nr:4'-phosphopantetheinyl transferase superfamily protein [Filimonas sp.]
MPLFYQQDINEHTRLAVWHITEPEAFFLAKVPLKRDITHPNKRLQHLAGRYILQYLFPDFPYSEMLIADSRKPYLPDEQYHFSISHCGSYAAAIVSKEERVGIDIENITHKVARIRDKFLHKEENLFVAAQFPDEEAIPLLTILWSAKEAIFKWWSFGSVDFSEDIRLAEFTFSANGGEMDGIFIRNTDIHAVHLHYRIIGEISLVWTGK